jgi:hypothetical protein
MPEPEQEEIKIASGTAQELPPDVKKAIAIDVLSSLDSQTQKDIVTELQLLPVEQRRAIANSLMPTQPVTDWIWKVTVGVFASVFVLATLATSENSPSTKFVNKLLCRYH